MFLNDLMIALLFALLFTAVFTGLLRTRGPWASIPLFFVVLFVMIWAGGIWLSPAGSSGWGVRWLPFMVVGLIVSLFLAAVVVENEPRPGSTVELVDAEKERQERKVVRTTLSVFFWVLLALLLLVIILRYIR